MERYRPPEIATEGGKEKHSKWKKAKTYTEVVAMSTLITAAGIEGLKAQESAQESPERGKKIENLQKEAAQDEKKIFVVVTEKGAKFVNNFGKISRELKTEKGELIKVGYDSDGNPDYLVQENADASFRFDLVGRGFDHHPLQHVPEEEVSSR